MAKLSVQEYGGCTYLICRTLLATPVGHLPHDELGLLLALYFTRLEDVVRQVTTREIVNMYTLRPSSMTYARQFRTLML